MPLSHVTKWFGVSDAKIKKITADPAGGTTTFATAVDVPGIKAVGISGDVTNNDLRGDNTLLDSNSVLGSIEIEFEHGKLSLDVLPVLLGGTTADSGTTPNQVAAYTLDNTGTFSYFQFEAKTPTAGVDSVTGDGHITLYKCILSEFPEMGFEEEDYRIFSVTARALPRLSDNKWINVTANETAVAIS